MKKKTYKAMQRRYLRVLKQKEELRMDNRLLEKEKEAACERSERLKKRFLEFGRNVETSDPENGKVVTEKWELCPDTYGDYMMFDARQEDMTQVNYLALIDQYRAELVKNLVKGMMEDQLVQFYTRESDYPVFGGTILGAKIYAVPWEQMPHKRKIELRQFINKTLEEDERI